MPRCSSTAVRSGAPSDAVEVNLTRMGVNHLQINELGGGALSARAIA